MTRTSSIDLKDMLLVFLILDQTPIGRYRLARNIGTTKAKTRALLSYLVKEDYATSKKGRGGTRLTSKGKKIAKELKKMVYLDMNGDLFTVMPGLIPDSKIYTILLLNVSDPDTTGIYERDLAVREGAEGAITVIRNHNSRWVFPGEEERVVQSLRVINELTVNKYNMAIISFANNFGSASSGAAAAAVYHLENEINTTLPLSLEN